MENKASKTSKVKDVITKVKNKVVGKKNKKPDYKVFEYGDLYLTCSCGAKVLIKKSIPGPGGIRIDIPTTDKHEFIVGCDQCKHWIKLNFEKGSAPEELSTERVSEPSALPETK